MRVLLTGTFGFVLANYFIVDILLKDFWFVVSFCISPLYSFYRTLCHRAVLNCLVFKELFALLGLGMKILCLCNLGVVVARKLIYLFFGFINVLCF